MTDNYCVLIPVKNSEEFISETIVSIKEQIKIPSEIIFIDDGSQDGSIDKISRELSSAVILQNDGIGQAAALNTGIRYAQSEFITFLDTDDLWPKNKNINQIQSLQNNKNIDVVLGGVTNFFGDFHLPLRNQNSRYFPESRALCASMFRKTVFEKYGYFESGSIHFVFSWWSRVTKANIALLHSHENSLYRRVHEKNRQKSTLYRADLFVQVRNHVKRDSIG